MIDGGKLLKGLMAGGFGGSTRKAVAGGSGLLMLGGIAYAAFEHFSEKRPNPTSSNNYVPPPMPGGQAHIPPPPPQMAPPQTTPPPLQAVPPKPVVDDAADNAKALLLVKAMIASAKADGEIDADERAAILKALDDQGQGSEAHAFVEAEMQKPLNLFEITSEVRDEMTASEVYAASCLAVDIDTDEERLYLDRLAARLGIEPEQQKAIEHRLNAMAGS